MIDTELVQHRGLQIVDVDRVADRVPADRVGLAVGISTAYSTACHEERKGVWMMIATGHARIADAVFSQWRPAKFAAANDQCFVEQPSLLQVLDQSGDRLVDHLGVVFELHIQFVMVIPGGKDDVDEPYATFDHASGKKAIGRKRLELVAAANISRTHFWLGTTDTVVFERLFCLARKVGQFRSFGLHAKRQFIVGNAAGQSRDHAPVRSAAG